MRQTGLLWAALLCWGACFVVGHVAAQSPVSSTEWGQSVSAPQTGYASPAAAQSMGRRASPARPPENESAFIAVIGAVKKPTVFESSERAVPLGVLLQQAGGETSESIGTVRILDHAQTRFMASLDRNLALPITDGQVVFVVPAGGRPAQVSNPRQAPPNRFVLISGLSRGPLLFNIGNESHTFGDLLQLLGQNPEMLERQQVKATLPHGQWMELDSLLVHNTVIHFAPEAVSTEGVRQAVDRGFRYELPVKVASPTAVVEPLPTLTTQGFRPVDTQEPESALLPPAMFSNKLPEIRPQPQQIRNVPHMTAETPEEPRGADIEPANSTIPFDEPMPFPKRTEIGTTPQAPSSSLQSPGQVPLMLPRTWQSPDGEEAPDESESPTQVIERTSADRSVPPGGIVPVSAEVEAKASLHSGPTPATEPTPLDANEFETAMAPAATTAGPPTWLVLVITLGVAIVSLVVSRRVLNDRDSESDLAAAASSKEHRTVPRAAPPEVVREPREPVSAEPSVVSVAFQKPVTAEPLVSRETGAPEPIAVQMTVKKPVAEKPVTGKPVVPEFTAKAPKTAEESESEGEQRFLQRLIMNKVPLVEEEAILPPVDRLHGMVIGERRLVIHDSHSVSSGPHFTVRDPQDTRVVELRLRTLMRHEQATHRMASAMTTTGEVMGSRSSRVSPLEKALRSVEQGGTQ